jgi:hypothetical protein
MNSTTAPTKADRETIFVKIRFLSTAIGQMGEMLDKGIMDDEDFFAIAVFLDGIAKEIYPEHFSAEVDAA